MSLDSLQTQSPFIELLLTTTKPQQRMLIKTITPEQILVLLEILYNLFILPHSVEDQAFYSRQKRFLSKFKLQNPLVKRKRALLSRPATVLKVLNHFKSKLLSLI